MMNHSEEKTSDMIDSLNGLARMSKQKSSNNTMSLVAAEKGPADVPDLLQFACGSYYCMEGETDIQIKVERLGNPDGSASVEYSTADGSAKAGIKYKPVSGVAQFEPQQTEVIIKIELIEDDSFDSVLEFHVVLRNATGAALDSHLNACEITIADDDAFPTNKYRDKLLADEFAHVPEMALLIEYFKMHMQDRKLFWQSFTTVLCDQLANLKMIWSLVLIKYLIDYLLDNKEGAEPPFEFLLDIPVQSQVYAIVCFLLLPHPLEWMLDLAKSNRRMGGKARMRLQCNLLRKFLNYSEHSRDTISNSDLTMAVTRDVPELVRDGLMMTFPILQKLSLLLMYGFFAMRMNPVTGIYFVAFPVLMLAFLRLRLHKTEQLTQALFEQQTNLVSRMQKITDFFRIIADYEQKQETVESFSIKIGEYNDSNHGHANRHVTNRALAPLLTTFFVGIYILQFYAEVRAPGGMGVGDFVTGVGIWRGIGSCYEGIYDNILTMQNSISNLHNVVHYMNLPLDIAHRAASKRNLLQELDGAQDAAAGLFYEGKPTDCPLVQTTTDIVSGDIVEKAAYSQDLIQIDCCGVNFTFPAQGDHPAKQILDNASFEISQGQLVAVVGPTGSGKSTLLNLLGGVLVPQPGNGLLFIPPHLRVLHVTRDPTIFHDCNIWDNLLYGEVADEEADPKRILKICHRIGMSEDLLASLEEHLGGQSLADGVSTTSGSSGKGIAAARRMDAEQKAVSMSSISYTDRCLIHLARALITNPDVLIVHKPLSNFNGVDMERVLAVLREFVDLRGFESPPGDRRGRRPRTCIMSFSSLEGVDVPDLVLQVKNMSVQTVDMHQVSNVQGIAKEMVRVLDIDGDGSVSRDEFVSKVLSDTHLAKLFDISDEVLTSRDGEGQLRRVFDKLDFNKSGSMRTEELMKIIQDRLRLRVPTKSSDRSQEERPPAPSGARQTSDCWDMQLQMPEESPDTLSHRVKCAELRYSSSSSTVLR